MTACNEGPLDPAPPVTIAAGSETGILNALYAMEQLTNDFFSRVNDFPYPGMTAIERAAFAAVAAHDEAHVLYFVENVSQGRTFDAFTFRYATVDFGSRESVLGTARSLKDGAAASYLAALPRLTDPAVRNVVAKIAAVESRHAAVVRDIAAGQRTPPDGTAFAGPDAVTADGLARVVAPGDALAAFTGYFRNPITVRS